MNKNIKQKSKKVILFIIKLLKMFLFNIKNFLSKNWFKLFILLLIIIFVFIMYQALVVIPKGKMIQYQTQQQKEYASKRKGDCYEIEQKERKNWNNIDGSFYKEEDDTCVVRYVQKKWKEGDPNSCELFEKIINPLFRRNDASLFSEYLTRLNSSRRWIASGCQRRTPLSRNATARGCA